jgi:hypothetical protein
MFYEKMKRPQYSRILERRKDRGSHFTQRREIVRIPSSALFRI